MPGVHPDWRALTRPSHASKRHPAGYLQWAAGFYEGEGWCSYRRSSGRNVGHVKNSLVIAVCQNEDWPLEKFGAAVVYGHLYRRPDRKQGLWIVTGDEAAEVALRLYPLLSPRRQRQIDKAVRAWLTRPLVEAGVRIKGRRRMRRKQFLAVING
jgi:hypothetical protein